MSSARLRLLLVFPLILLLALVSSVRDASAQACPKIPGRYKVRIDSVPPGATIYINGKNCPSPGMTPWSGKLNNGTFQVTVEAQGFEPATKTFVVARLSREQALTIQMQRKPTIEVRADADRNLVGASVSVDGVPQGVIQGPLVVQTTAGRHQVEIKKDGFETLTQWIDLTNTPSIVLTPVLKEIKRVAYGIVVVDSDPQDAEVYIDGNKHPDNTPTVINQVVEGVHVIEVKKGSGPAWQKTITVVANQQTKLRADLSGGVGVIRVLSDTPGAKAFLDGIEMGPTPVDIKDVKAGEHIVQVRAQGYKQAEKTVMVTGGGSQIVKLDLAAEGADQGTLKIVSKVPDAEVYIDGASVGRAPIEKKVSPGDHLVLVKLPNHKDFEKKVNAEAGKTVTVEAELKAVGRLRLLSTPAGASVIINGIAVGTTPFDQEVEVGETIVRIDSPGRIAFEQTVNIEGGKTLTLSRELAVQGKTETELLDEQKGLSSYGARTLPRGRSTADFEFGYPYFLGARINVGAGRVSKHFGLDASVGVRTFLARTELGFGARAMVANQEPFSAALFGDMWFGSALFDNSLRNGVTFDAGVAASLTALANVTITGRAYFQFYSDRHCPALRQGSTEYEDPDAEPTTTCEDWRKTVLTQDPDYMADADFNGEGVGRLVGVEAGDDPRDFFDREQGARFLISVAAEIATKQHWNLFGIIEGAPFQDERALFTNYFSGTMPKTDFVLYARFGATYKF